MDLTGKKAFAFKLACMDAFQYMKAIPRRLPAFGAWSRPSIWSPACKTLMQGDADQCQHSRCLPNLSYAPLRHAQPIATDLMLVSFDSVPTSDSRRACCA